MDKGITHIHEGPFITPSCTDNDVHKGSQWAIYVATVVNVYTYNGGPCIQAPIYSD